MSEIKMVKAIKIIHPSTVIMVKIGNFYHVYGKDSYILSYLLSYKILQKDEIPHCGFPIGSVSKVENVLEKLKVNYVLVDKRNNYEEEYKYVEKQENKYDEIYEKAKSTVSTILRIQKINQELLDQKDNKNIVEILDKIEKEIINEGRKI